MADLQRFTDRARKVMQLANQEAQRFNHERIDTWHILLGLVKEGSGVAAYVLKNLGVLADPIRRAVLDSVRPDIDVVVMGKRLMSSAAEKSVAAASEESKGLGHNYIGTEHLLLGLLHGEDGDVALRTLKDLGIEKEAVREEILLLLNPPQAIFEEERKRMRAGWEKMCMLSLPTTQTSSYMNIPGITSSPPATVEWVFGTSEETKAVDRVVQAEERVRSHCCSVIRQEIEKQKAEGRPVIATVLTQMLKRIESPVEGKP